MEQQNQFGKQVNTLQNSQNNRQTKQQHTLEIDDRKRVTATAIDEVDGFSSQQIVLSCGGDKLIITGSQLKIVGFSKTGGTFSAVGTVSGVKYVAKNALKKRLFG
jgi:uncharacterized protein (DUF2345 family)